MVHREQAIGAKGWKQLQNEKKQKEVSGGRGITRRDFLWKAPLAATGTALAIKEVINGEGRKFLGDLAAGLVGGINATASPTTSEQIAKPADVEPTFSQTFLDTLKKEDIDRLRSMEKVILEEVNLLMAGKDKAHISKALEQVGYHVLANFNRDTDLKNSSSREWIKIINEVAPLLDNKPDSFVLHFLPGVIYAESSGNPKQLGTNKIDAGLCQMQPDNAAEIYKRLTDRLARYSKGTDEESKKKSQFLTQAIKGIKFNEKKEIDLFDPKTNITLTLEYIDYLYDLFPDKSLTLWGVNMGNGNLINALVASRGQSQSRAQEIKHNLSTFANSKQAYKDVEALIKGNSPADAIDFTNMTEWNSARAYPARIIASRTLMRVKNLL
ncbi:MAG: hypothetical protein HYW86_02385 [Candidatus Roizmanbacteria bacterium]|nr:MAG: hypothetical protein HYW86_02385 [Candidatus Roizmanbacteria bacterium]